LLITFKLGLVLKSNDVRISMDSKGRWVDNVMIERLWRSVKYEEVYLKAYGNMAAARSSLKSYFRFYNDERRHHSLDDRTPDDIYFETAVPMAASPGKALRTLYIFWGPLLLL